MATALTQANLDTLNGYVLSGDAIGYYNQLANYGYDYGRLAAGLVDNTTFNEGSALKVR
jgi:hypothetical protein